MANKILGLEIGERFISCALADKGSPSTASILAYDKIDINIYQNDTDPNEEKIVTLLQKLVKDASVPSRNVSLVIPDTRSYTTIFEMPSMTEKELISAIRYQADQLIPIPIDKVSMDIDVLWEDKQNKKQHIILVAAANSIVERISRIVEKAGLVPLFLENETSASLQIMSMAASLNSAAVKDASPLSLYLNFGIGSTSLCLFDAQRSIPLQVHNFSIGLDIFSKEIKTNFALSDEDTYRLITEVGLSKLQSSYKIEDVVAPALNELVSQIQRFILSVKEKNNSPIQNVYIFGEGSVLKSIDKRLGTLLGVNAVIFNPAPYFAANNVTNFFASSLSLFVPVLGSSLSQTL